MRLSNLIEPIEGLKLHGQDAAITGLALDSRDVKPGYLFVAVPGTQQDGFSYIDDATRNGAAAVLIPENRMPETPFNVPLVTAPDVRAALSSIAARFYPAQPDFIAAVTGTSGKTSVAQFTREIWQANGHESASIGTLGLVTSSGKSYGSLTTPDAITLHKTLDETARRGVTHLALEASSHGIDLHRIDHVRLHAAAFTNLSRDHLDYHDGMESYLAAKLRLFTHLLPEGKTAVLNADAPEFSRLAEACRTRRQTIIGYGRNGKDIRLNEHRLHGDGQVLRFTAMGKNYEVRLPIAGAFQVWNSLCALGLAIASGEAITGAVGALEKVTGVAGRLERIGTTAKGGAVYVDYAHKPGALENVLTAMRAHVAAQAGARLYVVFGCGGNRDKGKRPPMGSIAQKLADVVIVTDDNPRDEIPEKIRADILAGCAKGPNLREIGDRAAAIRAAVAELNDGDVLIIAGKGHETGQIVGNRVLPFDDAAVARQAINEKT
jgi:UDP-N-acetylmuramoyl-L-alanyl-D-glutamate--2,6-diaminopimelate ligase